MSGINWAEIAAALTAGAAFLGALWAIIKGLLKFYFIQQAKLEKSKSDVHAAQIAELRATISSQRLVIENHKCALEDNTKELKTVMVELQSTQREVRDNNQQLGKIGKSLQAYITQNDRRLKSLEDQMTNLGRVILKS